MSLKSFADELVVRELSHEELNAFLDVHFQAAFANRQEDRFVPSIGENAKDKIRQRDELDRRYSLRLGAFINGEFAGWHCGWSTDSETYYMSNSAVVEKFRGQGVYQRLLGCVLRECQAQGFQVITSTHHANNSAILIPKLKSGFIISGVQFHERFRFLVELRYFVDPKRRQQVGCHMGLDL